ncbi:MAG: CoA ester lyase [Pseudomonadota bacterium]
MSEQRQYSGLRSFLFTPGNHPRKVAKVFDAGADAIILDLEDAVANAEKVTTRAAVIAALANPRTCRGYVRVNGTETEWWRDDIDSVVTANLDGIVLPKVETTAALLAVDQAISNAERRLGLAAGSIDLMPIVETAAGVEQVAEFAGATARVRRLAFGGGDYTLDLDLIWNEDEAALDYARAKLAHASRVAGLEPPIDTVVLQIRDDARFSRSAERGRTFGFAGKLCIHPQQVALCHAVFTPTAAEIDHARRVVAAFEQAEAAGSASIQLDGYFIDYPIVYKAQRILAFAERVAESRSQLEEHG